jgi:uncharacterized membrane protein YcjF (UPF0283 family)
VTSTVTPTTVDFLQEHPFSAVSTSVGVALALLLLVLLISKELLRAAWPSPERASFKAIDVAVIPLLVVVVMIVLERFRILS